MGRFSPGRWFDGGFPGPFGKVRNGRSLLAPLGDLDRRPDLPRCPRCHDPPDDDRNPAGGRPGSGSLRPPVSRTDARGDRRRAVRRAPRMPDGGRRRARRGDDGGRRGGAPLHRHSVRPSGLRGRDRRSRAASSSLVDQREYDRLLGVPSFNVRDRRDGAGLLENFPYRGEPVEHVYFTGLTTFRDFSAGTIQPTCGLGHHDREIQDVRGNGSTIFFCGAPRRPRSGARSASGLPAAASAGCWAPASCGARSASAGTGGQLPSATAWARVS